MNKASLFSSSLAKINISDPPPVCQLHGAGLPTHVGTQCPTEPLPSSVTAAPVVSFIPQASIVPKTDAEFVNARLLII